MTDLIGIDKDELDTPALLVDLDRFEANIAHLAGVCAENGVPGGRTPRRTRVPRSPACN